ncbi:MAG: hypothetical protein JO362_20345 [Streptomycetaceae bacterium]|nr:hypothetical protein [Streptomycetaceae bacterium]
MTLSTLSPAVPRQQSDVLTVVGTLDNHGAQQIVGARLGVRIDEGSEISSRTEPLASLSPGQSLSFTLTIPVSALGLTRTGDYRFAVDLVGSDGGELGLATTELPWYPSGADSTNTSSGKPLNVAVVWPVTDSPHLEAVSLGEGGTAQPVFRDDGLAAELAVGGRLHEVVAAGAGLPVTWTVDPALLDEAKAMARGYRVARTPNSSNPQDSVKGTGGQVAAAWLAATRSAVAGHDVIALPYADPDVASLAHHAPGNAALLGLVGDSVQQARAAISQALGISAGMDIRTDTAWPYGGALDTSVTALAERFGLKNFIASGMGLSTGTTQPQVQLEGGASAMVAEPTTRAVLSHDLSGNGDQLIARQQLLGDLLKTQQRDPRNPGGIVVEPPRQMPAQTASVLSEALRAAQAAGFVKLVGLGQLGSGPSADAQSALPSAQVAGIAEYAEGLSESELTRFELRAVTRVQPDLERLAQVLSDSSRTMDSVRRAMLRGISTGWRDDRQDADSYREGVGAYIDASIASVRLLQKHSTITVAGNSASVPITVANGLQQPLAGLELRVSSSAPQRLAVETPYTPVQVPTAANRTEQVQVTAYANGPVRLTARLYTTANGRPWGDPMTFQVTISKVSPGAIAIVVGGVVLVLLAGAWKMHQARRKRQQPSPLPPEPPAP